jgi:hypothetical protein
VDQRCAPALERREIDGFILRRAIRPTPIAETAPFERQGPHGGLLGFALVALLLIVDLGPEGMPDRLCRPLHKGVPEERWTSEAPVPPGLLPATLGHRCDPRLFVQCRGGGIAFAWLAAGDQEARSADGASAWEGLDEREVGMALSTRRDGGVESRARRQSHAEVGHEGLDEEGLGRHHAVSSGEGEGRFAGLETLGNDLRSTHVLVPKAGFEGRTAGTRRGVERRPAAEGVAAQRGSFGLAPLPHVWERVLTRTGQAGGDPDVVAHHTAAVLGEWGARTHRRALRREGWQLIGGCE